MQSIERLEEKPLFDELVSAWELRFGWTHEETQEFVSDLLHVIGEMLQIVHVIGETLQSEEFSNNKYLLKIDEQRSILVTLEPTANTITLNKVTKSE